MNDWQLKATIAGVLEAAYQIQGHLDDARREIAAGMIAEMTEGHPPAGIEIRNQQGRLVMHITGEAYRDLLSAGRDDPEHFSMGRRAIIDQNSGAYAGRFKSEVRADPRRAGRRSQPLAGMTAGQTRQLAEFAGALAAFKAGAVLDPDLQSLMPLAIQGSLQGSL